MGTRESLNGRKNVARRKVKNGEKSPWGQCLTRPVPHGRCRSVRSLFSPFFTFLRAIFSRPFRLSLVPTICPWVSEDAPSSNYVIYWQVCPGSLFEQLQCKNYTDLNFLTELKLGINIFIYMGFNKTSVLPRLAMPGFALRKSL